MRKVVKRSIALASMAVLAFFGARWLSKSAIADYCDGDPEPGVEIYGSLSGPLDVPGFSQYSYTLRLPSGAPAPTGVMWHVHSGSSAATIVASGSTGCTVRFSNVADIVSLNCEYTVGGVSAKVPTKSIAIVQINLGETALMHDGVCSETSGLTHVFQVSSPSYNVAHDPGSNLGAFTFSGIEHIPEHGVREGSSSGETTSAIDLGVAVTLVAPRSGAVHHIQLGMIQKLSLSGTGNYHGGHTRTVAVPLNDSVDWLEAAVPSLSGNWWASLTSSAWPFAGGSWTPSGDTDTYNALVLDDSPEADFPYDWNPDSSDWRAAHNHLETASQPYTFVDYVAARTTETDNGADKLYFDEGHLGWVASYSYPIPVATSIVSLTGGNSWSAPTWSYPSDPSQIEVNVYPGLLMVNPPFFRWRPAGISE